MQDNRHWVPAMCRPRTVLGTAAGKKAQTLVPRRGGCRGGGKRVRQGLHKAGLPLFWVGIIADLVTVTEGSMWGQWVGG